MWMMPAWFKKAKPAGVGLVQTKQKIPHSAVIVGCAKNIHSFMQETKRRLRMLSGVFAHSAVMVYENDSTDKTLEELRAWEKEGWMRVISEKNVNLESRTQALSHCRNVLLRQALQHNTELLVVVDLDDRGLPSSEDAVRACFDMQEDWGMIGANQQGTYYDLWALRTFSDWMPYDCWECDSKAENDAEKKKCFDNAWRNIPQSSPPMEVKSAFGGMAIYKTKYLKGCDYGNGINPNRKGSDKDKCEHVDLHECVRRNGGKLFINPKCINL